MNTRMKSEITAEIPDIRPDWDKPNYDAAKIAPYTLEDPLVSSTGGA